MGPNHLNDSCLLDTEMIPGLIIGILYVTRRTDTERRCVLSVDFCWSCRLPTSLTRGTERRQREYPVFVLLTTGGRVSCLELVCAG